MVSLLLLLAASLFQGAASAGDGRLVVQLRDSTVAPVAVQINGPRSSRRDRLGQLQVTFDSLPQGTYDVQPAYDAGILGAHYTIVVEADKTATLSIPTESVGAVRLDAAPETCADTFRFGLEHAGSVVGMPAAAASTVARFQKRIVGCNGVVSGLTPGSYVAFYSDGIGNRISTAQVTVREQQLTTVVVGPPAARVSGRVTYNGQPPVLGSLYFQLRGDPHLTMVIVPLDQEGRYSTNLPRSGLYSIQLFFDRTASPLTTSVQTSNGINTFDWAATGGSLAVSLTGWNRRSAVQVWVEGYGAVVNTFNPNSQYPFRVIGLPAGVYRVTAYEQPSGLSSRAPVVATLDDSRPDAAVELALVENTGTIALRDEAGAPVPHGSIRGPFSNAALETAPGLLSLRGIPLGVDLQISAPGFVPACAQSRIEAQTLTLLGGRPVDIVFEHKSLPVAPLGELVLAQGAAPCVVPLEKLTFKKIVTSASSSTRFRFENFPDVESFVWQSSGARQSVIVPATGPIVIK